MALLKARSRAGTMANSDMQEMLSLPLCNQTQIRPPESRETQHLEGPMSMDMRDEAVQKRCVPTPQRMGARSMVVGIWQTNYPMAMGIQQRGSDRWL